MRIAGAVFMARNLTANAAESKGRVPEDERDAAGRADARAAGQNVVA